jgi:hypothetical protein
MRNIVIANRYFRNELVIGAVIKYVGSKSGVFGGSVEEVCRWQRSDGMFADMAVTVEMQNTRDPELQADVVAAR